MADDPLIAWAREEPQRLRRVASTIPSSEASATTARARQFFADHASGTTFEGHAQRVISYQQSDDAIRSIATQLEEWCDYQESAAANVKPFEVRFRIEAATDLLEQVQLLLKDPQVHVAAPIVLAGAALEEFLRSMFEESGEPLVGKPGISSYPEALRKSDLLSRGEVKSLGAVRELRRAPCPLTRPACSPYA